MTIRMSARAHAHLPSTGLHFLQAHNKPHMLCYLSSALRAMWFPLWTNKPDFSCSRGQGKNYPQRSFKLNRNWAVSNEDHCVTVDPFKAITAWTLVSKALPGVLFVYVWLCDFSSSGFWKICICMCLVFEVKEWGWSEFWILSITV